MPLCIACGSPAGPPPPPPPTHLPQAISWALNRGALCALPLTRAQFLAVFALPITPKVSEEGGAPAGSGPGSSATASRSVTPAGGSSTSLASGWAGGFAPAESATATAAARGKAGGAGSGDGGVGPGMHRSRSGGRLADDAGGSRAMARSWAGKNVMLLAVLGALRWELPALAEALCYGARRMASRAGGWGVGWGAGQEGLGALAGLPSLPCCFPTAPPPLRCPT